MDNSDDPIVNVGKPRNYERDVGGFNGAYTMAVFGTPRITFYGDSSDIDDAVEIVSHEWLHYILEREVGHRASSDLDNLVEYGEMLTEADIDFIDPSKPLIEKIFQKS